MALLLGRLLQPIRLAETASSAALTRDREWMRRGIFMKSAFRN